MSTGSEKKRSIAVASIGMLIALSGGAADVASGGVAQRELVDGAAAVRADDHLSRLAAMGYNGAALVAQDGRVVLRKGYGLADREAARPVTPDTVFTTGSVSKQFTGAAIMKLVDEGRLSTDDPITRFFDGVPEDKHGITVHQLLTHTAGLADVFGDDFDTEASRDWLLQRVLESDLIAPPGQQHSYSNSGYALLGMIIEDVSGKGYEEFLRDELFLPAGMVHTGYVLPGYAGEALAIGYENDERWGTILERPMLGDGPSWNLRASGGIHSTLDDMFRWYLALTEGRVLSPASQEAYERPWVDEGSGDSFYGYGWVNMETPRSTRLLWHSGGNGIFSADARRYVDEDTFVFVTSSVAHFTAPELAESLDAVLFGGDFTMPPAVLDIDPAALAERAGRYELRPGDAITLTPRAHGLEATPEGCWAQFLVHGGGGVVPETAPELIETTMAILRAAIADDFTPLRETLGETNEAMEASQSRYNRMQTELGGALLDMQFKRCVTFEGQLKIVAELQMERGTLYRWLRWVDGGISGWGFGEILAGGPERMIFYPVAADRFVAYTGGLGVVSEFSIRPDAAGDSLVFGEGADRVSAPRRGPGSAP